MSRANSTIVMSDSQHQYGQQPDFYAFLKAEEERKAKRRVELLELIRAVPVPDEVLREVTWLGPMDRDAVLRVHPGHQIERKLRSLWSMLAIFTQAQ